MRLGHSTWGACFDTSMLMSQLRLAITPASFFSSSYSVVSPLPYLLGTFGNNKAICIRMAQGDVPAG